MKKYERYLNNVWYVYSQMMPLCFNKKYLAFWLTFIENTDFNESFQSYNSIFFNFFYFSFFLMIGSLSSLSSLRTSFCRSKVLGLGRFRLSFSSESSSSASLVFADDFVGAKCCCSLCVWWSPLYRHLLRDHQKRI